jgi:beta-N-acetylhexosaminidase
VLVTGWGVATTQALAGSLTKRGATTTVAQTGAAPTDAAIADAVAKAQANDVTVVLTQKAWDTRVTDRLGKQQQLVKALLATGRTVIVVAVRDPYDIAYFDEAPTYLATLRLLGRLDGIAREGPVRRDRADGQAPGRHPGRRPADPPRSTRSGHGLSW